MSYYGASGTKRVYVATDQPLYGLGSEPSPAAPQINVVTKSDELMSPAADGKGTLMQAIENALASKGLGDLGVLCLGVGDKYNEYNNIPTRQIFQLWQSKGNFVVLRKGTGASFCSQLDQYSFPTVSDQRAATWTAYEFPKENIGAIAGDPNSFVWGLPFGDTDWSKYAQYLPVAAGGTSTKTPELPKVVVEPPKVDPSTGKVSAAGMPTWIPWAGAAVIAYFAWKWYEGRQYEANLDDYEQNCWDLAHATP